MTAVIALNRSFDLFDLPLGSVIHAAHEAIVMIDERQVILALNPAAQQMFGCTAQQVLGESLERFMPAPCRAAHGGHVHAFAHSGQLERAMAHRRRIQAVRANGETFPVEIALSRVDSADAQGARSYFVALMRDLSMEQTLSEALAGVRERMRAVFELAPIALWIADNDVVVYANRAAGRLMGTETGEALLGLSVHDMLHPDSRAALRRQVALALAGDPALANVQGILARRDGQVREVEIALAALPDHGRTTVQMVVADITQRQVEAIELDRSRRALRQLSANVVEAREEERRRIARELHDELGQRLTALKMDVSELAATTGLGVNDSRVVSMLAMLDETVASVRRIAGDLRPLMLDDLGLDAAIEWLADDASRRLGIDVRVELGDIDPLVDERAAIALYRMVQEALTNVARHARASEVQIGLCRQGNELLLSVQDNGIGFTDQALRREGSYGLMGMRERAHMLGGRFAIDNPPEGGGRIRVHLPVLTENAAGPPPQAS